jgi:hypothetical protein
MNGSKIMMMQWKLKGNILLLLRGNFSTTGINDEKKKNKTTA